MISLTEEEREAWRDALAPGWSTARVAELVEQGIPGGTASGRHPPAGGRTTPARRRSRSSSGRSRSRRRSCRNDPARPGRFADAAGPGARARRPRMTRLVALWEGWVAYLLLPGLALLVTRRCRACATSSARRWPGPANVKELALLGVVTAGLPGALAGRRAHPGLTLVDERLPASGRPGPGGVPARGGAGGRGPSWRGRWPISPGTWPGFGERAEFPAAALLAVRRS